LRGLGCCRRLKVPLRGIGARLRCPSMVTGSQSTSGCAHGLAVIVLAPIAAAANTTAASPTVTTATTASTFAAAAAAGGGLVVAEAAGRTASALALLEVEACLAAAASAACKRTPLLRKRNAAAQVITARKRRCGTNVCRQRQLNGWGFTTVATPAASEPAAPIAVPATSITEAVSVALRRTGQNGRWGSRAKLDSFIHFGRSIIANLYARTGHRRRQSRRHRECRR
jgi:hypothetical protein